MNIAFFIFIVLIAGWLLEWFVYEDTAKKRKGVKKNNLYIKGLLAIMFLCVILTSYLLSNVTEGTSNIAKMIGLVLITQGLFIRYWTYFITKPYFTRMIIPLENRPLYSDGPFRFTRHPFHTGFFFITLGIGLYISGHWFSIFFSFVFVGTALHYYMSLEENIYTKKYGDIYTYWCRHRFRLLPFLY
ncbi:isoprenylcysteine carboxylmethyltransferase family protein [Evansella sp. AB-P1]|uniref:isoprenylcysteine carboxylmethyltransferase family protein n=1 Tax=Evansella sp. AB-P1 TaxID=3037653 RepID=UPI00241BF364|nr:isoprenylcysteine carboxylmethyltransferase family protein [Evansella sp. AB-P1]MDG5788939.1 isoprenylcysteine carboxylmethyltransferase family protein [Evansella sp. AB-P1]